MTALTPGSNTKRVGIGEGLEAVQPQLAQPAHTSVPACSTICPARRRRPAPPRAGGWSRGRWPGRRPRSTAATREGLVVRRAGGAHQFVVWLDRGARAAPIPASGSSPTSAARAHPAPGSGAANRPRSQVARDVQALGQEDAPATASKAAASSDGRVAPPASASPRPSRRYRSSPISSAKRGERIAVDERGAAGGQESLVLVGVALVEQAADDQADDGVAEELEALVVPGDGVRDSR